MRVAVSLLCLLVLGLRPAEAKPLQHLTLQGCSANIRLLEVRKHLTAMLQHVTDGDPDIAIITNRVLNSVKESDRCCFLRELAEFYVRGVFTQCNAVLPLHARKHGSPLANTFYIMSQDLQACGCECEGDTLLKIQHIRRTFEKMEKGAGVEKALCDLEILLSWMEHQL
ncbi:interleukin-20-like [Conger conger]|uniref:interleukin-20-like n=1 Tax=Conger conger TaxID=82655 RepID=UPI002A59F5CB|nr:interleukin-20-like [Conger conger]XP_061074667.1 interleukin-20-like [Conger conger]XP_061074668.1 interleukin-20-like [Conger conger]XP_061074669.1 interleukin-20-like [Conger conger]XP_061074670.1 interleukin-20-like [Conger conger]